MKLLEELMWPRIWRKHFKVCDKYKIEVENKFWIASVLFRVYYSYSYVPQASCNRKQVGDTGTLRRSHAECIHIESAHMEPELAT